MCRLWVMIPAGLIRRVATCLALLAVGFLAHAQEMPAFDRGKIAKPVQLLGLPLLPEQAMLVSADGQERPARVSSVEEAEATHGGYRSAGVPVGSRLVWTLGEGQAGSFYLYFLVRTGHQYGYEYVHPEMTYVAELAGQKIALEPVSEVGAVRVYQSPDGWGHDVGWIRSPDRLTTRAGEKLAIGCLEDYAFVSLGLLVSEEAHELTLSLVGTVAALQRGLDDGKLLVDRIAEVFPATREACDRARRAWSDAHAQGQQLLTDMERASEAMRQGETPDVVGLRDRADALARGLATTEESTRQALAQDLETVVSALAERERTSRIEREAEYWGREAAYAQGVARTYLGAARALAPADSLLGLRRAATYCWRAQQFLDRADAALAKASREKARPAALGEPDLAPRPRLEVLLNGVWEMSTEGSPAEAPQGGWFAMRVPHGPWHETMGQFMALDRRWPAGQAWAWYRTRFTVPEEMTGAAVFLRFGAVFHLCEAYVNGEFVGRHIGGFDDFEFDITAQVRAGQPAELLCFVHDTSYTALAKSDREGEPTGCSSGPNHYVISDLWGARFGGIWQDVSLGSRPEVWTDAVLVTPSVRRRELTVRTELARRQARSWPTDRPLEAIVRQEVLRNGEVVLSLPERRATVAPDAPAVETTVPWANPDLWGIGGEYGDPGNLYSLRTRLWVADGRNEAAGPPLDTRYDRFGFREFWIEDGHFWLNGRRLTLQGGGTWYLQESKIPHGNRWWAARFFGLERSMNVNIERWHRHGDVSDELFDLTDELGMLNEPEGPYWGAYGIPDLLGYSDWDDPVWVQTANDHYRRWVRKHFNHPSVVLWSIENETFCAPSRPPGMLDRFLDFGDVVKQVDPTRPVTYHGSENGRHATRNPRIEIVNLHYPGNDKVVGWREKWGGRPCIDGEFQNYPPTFLMSNNDRQVAAENLRGLQEWIESKWKHYREQDIAGSLYFLPYFVGLVSTARAEWMGPWGDLLGDLETAPVTESGWAKGQAQLSTDVPIHWPSLSGPGIKCEQLRTGLGHLSLINWFDPKRPEATPTPVAETIRDCWEPMPALAGETAPEVIVSVTQGGKPRAGVAVIAFPTADQAVSAVGAVADPAGTAWLVLPAAGRYRLLCEGRSVDWDARRLARQAPPGWSHIPRAEISLD